MLKACQEVAARHGLVVEAQDITGVDLRWGFDAAFRVSIPLPDGAALDPERLCFESLAEAFGLSPADYGRQFSTGRELFKITGIDPRPQVPGFGRTHQGRAGVQVHLPPSGSVVAEGDEGRTAEGTVMT
jgi:hypothetical protein